MRFEAEAQDLKFWGGTTSRFTDQASSWNGLQSVSAPVAASPGNGVNRITASKISYGAAFATTGPLDFLNYGQTTGSGIGAPTEATAAKCCGSSAARRRAKKPPRDRPVAYTRRASIR